jgi:hypothetical protein
MTLNKRDEAKVDTYDFVAPQPAHLFDPRAIGVITIFQYGRNAAGDALKHVGTEYKVRFERAQTPTAIKTAKQVVQALNSGTLYAASPLFSVSTGRPRGRQKAAV